MRLAGFKGNDLLAGAITIAIGLYAFIEAQNYGYGALRRMGPGFFPIWIGVLLMLLGVGIMIEGRRRDHAPARLAVRALLAVTSAILAFALLIRSAGLVPATFASVLLCSMAEPEIRPVSQILLAAAVSLMCLLVFIHGLGMTLQAFAW